ncbi:chromate efflux transporter [Rubrobacter indicoceani]|uniref:chromate efflux transporter n=1 Tax=Rubrobacter indicoceani TaxID=2051957 RepID=UPI0013C451BC|nr:chromate efflux transporter [Rubrobacter indicoceani]
MEDRETKAVGFGEAFRFWVKLGFINFGGPAGQIAIMHRELVEEKKWVSESQYLRTLNFCMLLPGPEAQQVATYLGWRMHGTLGGVVAGAFFVIPSIFILLLLSWLAAVHSDVQAIRGLLYGVQPVIIAVVVEAVLRIGGRALGHPALVAFAVLAFCALFFLGLPFPLVILAAAVGGVVLQRFVPDAFRGGGHGDTDDREVAEPQGRRSYAVRNLKTIGVFVALWAVPVGAVLLWRGADDVLFREALFFTGAAFVTFGGAYAVLTYLSDVAVNNYGWLTGDQMVQGLGLAESTPGPLIMVTQYVGFFGAYNDPGPFSPVLYGTLGALLTTYVTFLPCFLFIFLLAPYIELLSNNERLRAALTGVTAAVVGVIANLAVFFASQVLFPGEGSPGLLAGGLDLYALVVAVISFIALQRYGVKIYYAVPVGAVIGMLWVFLTT